MKNSTVDNVKQKSSLKELYRAYDYRSLDAVITSYKNSDGASERTSGAIKKAIHRGDEKLKNEIMVFLISHKPRKSQKFIDDIVKGFSNFIDSLSKSTGMQRKQVVAIFVFIFLFIVLFILSEKFNEHKESTQIKIKRILKEKNFKIKGFAELLYEEEFGSTGTEEEKNKFIQRVYKNLNDPNRNQATLQSYLNFARELEPMPS
ncbi:MAG: hypothetical protein ACPGVP_20605 [Thiolinea sp.]